MEINWDIDPKLKETTKIIIRTSVSDKIIKLFCEAIRVIARVAKPKPLKIIFYRKQFTITTSEDHVAVIIRNLILYDLDKIDEITDDRMILAVLLEELVHILLDMTNEVEVSLKVSELYPQIKADPVTGQYMLPS